MGLLPFICKGDALSNDAPAMGFKSPGIGSLVQDASSVAQKSPSAKVMATVTSTKQTPDTRKSPSLRGFSSSGGEARSPDLTIMSRALGI